MIVEHPNIKSPSSNIPLWRYMDFSKFVALLEKKSLYFCRGDILKNIDPYEGSYTKSELEFLDTQAMLITKGDPKERYEMMRYINHASQEYSSGTTFINCWHANSRESVAMWRVFISSNTGIAIKTDFDSLKQSLISAKPEIFASVIQYIDHYHDNISYEANVLLPMTRKNLAYEYEQEVRLMFMYSDSPPEYEDTIINGQHSVHALPSKLPGIDIPINLDELIKEIYIDPKADQWFVELVKEVFETYKKKHALKIKPFIRKSELSYNGLQYVKP